MSDQAPPDFVDSRSVDGLWHEVRDQVRRQVAAHRADDVVQEAFLRALRRPPPDPSAMSGWLRVVARRLAIRSERGERNRRAREREIARDRPFHTAEDDSPIDGRAALRLLDALEDPYRQVLRMRYLDGLEIAEIASALARPEVTVRSQVKRGLDRIRERLGLPSTRRKLPALVPLGWLRSVLRKPSARAAALLGAVGVCVIVSLLGGSSPERPGPARMGSIETSAGTVDLEPIRAPRRIVVQPLPVSPAPPPANEWAWSFEGRVIDARGRPVSSAAIRLGGVDDSTAAACARSDEAGRFRIEGADGRRWIWAQRDGELPSPRHLVASIDPGRELVLELGPEIVILRGRVTTSDGTAIPEATVALLGTNASDGSQIGATHVGPQATLEVVPFPTTVVRCDGAGAFRLPCADGEEARCLVSAPGVAPRLRSAWPGQHDALPFVLPVGGSVAGRLVDRGGAPQSGRSVRLDLPRPFQDRETVTSAEGTFRFTNVPECTFQLVQGDEMPRESASFFETRRVKYDDELWLDVTLAVESTLRGRAVCDASPLAGWQVELVRWEPAAFRERRTTRTDERGEFSFPSCSPRVDYVVRLLDPVSGRAVDWEKSAPPGDSLELVADAAGSASASVTGTIVADEPARRAVFVELSNPQLSDTWLARVDPGSGTFSIGEVPPGTHSLRAWVPGLGPVELAKPTLQPGAATALELVIPAAGILRARVSGASELAPERIGLVVGVPALNSPHEMTTRPLVPQPGGDFRCIQPPGRYLCTLFVDGKPYDNRAVLVESGATCEVTFEVPEQALVDIEISATRPLTDGELYALKARVESGGEERWFRLAKNPYTGKLRRVSLPRDTTRIVLETLGGLKGEWTGAASELPKSIVIVLESDG